MNTTPPVERGCGFRAAGGVYLTMPTGPVGHPIECFLLDPCQQIGADLLGLSPIGVSLFEDANGITHVMDWIGAENYPNVADFIEETRRHGVSRRVAKTLDFARLSVGSRLFAAHSRALIQNPGDWYDGVSEEDVEWHPCPAHTAYSHCGRGLATPHLLQPHVNGGTCARLWWHDVTGGEVSDDGTYYRTIGSTTYAAQERPEGVTPVYELALFGAFPIAQIEVVADREAGTHESAMIQSSQARLPLILVDE
jgi:hypothetical protein